MVGGITGSLLFRGRRIRNKGPGATPWMDLPNYITGMTSSYIDIIEDCLQVFENLPQLFLLRTTLGGRSGSSVSAYKNLIAQSIVQATRSLAVTRDAWAEDGHFAAISLLYDIAIFMYSCHE